MLIVGSGPREQELRALARELGVDAACVFIDPAVDDRFGVYDLLAALDVFVLPSLSEGIPMALLEAMALGRPAVAASVGGVPEIITDRVDGLLVEPRSPRAIANACLELARRPTWAASSAMRRWRRSRSASLATATARRSPRCITTSFENPGASGSQARVGVMAIATAPLRVFARASGASSNT